jgi:hypothetical protein
MANIKNRSMHVYLAQNKRHLEEGSERLKQQLEHIAELKRTGRDITRSIDLFRAMRQAHDRDERDHKLLLARLGW